MEGELPQFGEEQQMPRLDVDEQAAFATQVVEPEVVPVIVELGEPAERDVGPGS
ncbi:MAG: hypothetical protein ACXVGC_13225 [Mycobacteriaceae bacterium]